jgi:hypothetical protein
MSQQSYQLVVDFASDTILASIENDEHELIDFIASITPNNYLSALDFLKDNNYNIYPDLVTEIDYSSTEY